MEKKERKRNAHDTLSRRADRERLKGQLSITSRPKGALSMPVVRGMTGMSISLFISGRRRRRGTRSVAW